MLKWKVWLAGLMAVAAATLMINARADEGPKRADAAPAVPYMTEETLVSESGGKIDFTLFHYVNEHGEHEVAYQHDEKRALLPDTAKMVLFGRDLDGDGFYDAWFFRDETGFIEAVDRASNVPDGWDVASELLKEQIHPKRRWLVGIIFNEVTTGLTLSRSHEKSFFEALTREEMNLRDLEIRASRIRQEDPGHGASAFYDQLISEGWTHIADELSGEGPKKQFLLAAADVGFFVAGGAIVKGLGVAARWALPRIVESGAAKFAEEAYGKHLASIAERVKLGRSKLAAAAASSALTQPARWAAREVSERVALTLRGLEARGEIGRFAVKGLRVGTGVAKSGASEWKYITMTQSAQLVTEIVNRKDTVFSPNPVVLAKNVATNKDLVQNMSYMTAETFLMAAVSSHVASVPKRMAICAFISLIDSSVMSFLVKGETDMKRNALDTGWEVVVGNSQTQIDFLALSRFEAKSLKKGAPKLRLVGYALALADQTAGYFGYGYATSRYENAKAKKAAQATSTAPASADSSSHAVMIPVFAPQ